MNEFTNQVALITGAGSGIGRQLALDLAQEGAAVGLLDLKAEPLDSVAAELAGKRFACAVADVTDRDSLGKAIVQLEGQLGPIDLLFASAGIGMETSALNFRAADIEALIKVNLLGVANSIEAVLPGMIKRRRGHLVGISSLASYRGLPLMAGYCASKAGLNAMLDALRVELYRYNVHVSTVCPGWVRTPMTANVQLALRNLMDVSEASRRILGAVRKKRPFYAFPWNTVRHVRLLAWLPPSWGDWLIRRMFRGYVK
jgi:short-subunit dehydrogenase